MGTIELDIFLFPDCLERILISTFEYVPNKTVRIHFMFATSRVCSEMSNSEYHDDIHTDISMLLER